MKTTKEQFKTFKKEVEKQIKRWGMVDYELYIDHAETQKDDSMADTGVAIIPRQAIITLNKNSDIKLSNEKLKEFAKHEVLEMRFWKLESWIKKAYEEEAREEIHSIIQTIINLDKEKK